MTERDRLYTTLRDFSVDFAALWRQLPNKGFFLALLAAWLVLFQFLGNCTFGLIPTPSLMVWMAKAYIPIMPDVYDDSHARWVPLAVLALFWWKRRELMSQSLRLWSPGLLLLGAALLLHILGYRVQQPRVSILALFLGIYALMGLAWGPQWLRSSFFPYCLFIYCVPLGTLSLPISFPLRLLVCRLVEMACHYVLAIDIVRDGTYLMDPTGRYRYDVAPACGGLHSLVAILVIATIYAMVSFRGWRKRALLLASAFPLAVLGNFLRMLAIILAAEFGGQKWGEWFHDGGPFVLFGMHMNCGVNLLPYIPAFGGLMLLGHWLREPQADTVQTPAAEPAASSQTPRP